MNIALWIVAGVLAAAMLASGLMKLTTTKQQLVDKGQGWAEDFPAGVIKFIGLAEALGAVALILPAVLNIGTVLVPLAAVGLAFTMAGAVATHLRRKEFPGAVPSAVFLVLAVAVAVGRFGTYSF